MRRSIPLFAFLGLLVFTGAAQTSRSQATTWKVLVGEQTRPPAGSPKGATLNQFFPRTIEVNAGDKITFQSRGFHTVTYQGGRSSKWPAGFIPDPSGGTYEGINDSAGQPFYFDGLRKFIFEVPAFSPLGPKVIAGKVDASSGVIAPGPNGKPVTATYSFPKTGKYALICNIHPGMKMIVTARAAGASLARTPEEVSQAASDQTKAAWDEAKVLAARKVPKNTVFSGIGGDTTILGFFPKKLTVKAGTTVSFVTKAPSEAHNVAFGPKKYLEQFLKQNEFFPVGPKDKNQVAPVHLYGTEPRGGYTFDGQNHGNGFLVTPLTDGAPGGLPNVSRIKFTGPGKYHYICFLHGPDMSADIVVTR
jgi:plastocyanin